MSDQAEVARPPLPPFSVETAVQKVRMAEDAWNTRESERVALAYTLDSTWRNRAEFLSGREQIVAFLQRKCARELLSHAVSNATEDVKHFHGEHQARTIFGTMPVFAGSFKIPIRKRSARLGTT